MVRSSSGRMSDNLNRNIKEMNDAVIAALNGGMLHPSLQHGQDVLEEYIGRFGFSSMAQYDEYANEPITNHLVDHVQDRSLQVLMIAEKDSLAYEVFKAFHGNDRDIEKIKYGPNLDEHKNPKDVTAKLYKFRCQLFGKVADVYMIATNGHLYEQNYNHIIRQLTEETLVAKISDDIVDEKTYFNHFLEEPITGCDIVYLMLDDDHEGEYIAFEAIQLIKEVYERIYGTALNMKRYMDCILRVKFSSAPEAKDALQKPSRPDLRRALSMVAKHHLDLRYGVSMSRVQKSAVLKHLPHCNTDKLSFRACGNICLAIVNQYAAKNQFSIVKYCLEFVVHIDGKPITFSYGEYSEDEAKKKRKEIQKCSVKEGPIRGESMTVNSPAGLNTFELMKHVSRYFKIDTSDSASITQHLYQKGLISYPRSENSSYSENGIEVDAKQMHDNLLEYCALIETSPDLIKFKADMKVDFEKVKNKGIDRHDHPPIMPTGRRAFRSDQLSENSLKVYNFICSHFLASFENDYRYYEEKAVFDFGNLEVPFSWFKEESAGFTELLPELKVETLDKEMAALLAENLRPGATFKFDVRVKECPKPALLKEYELVQYMEDNHIGTDGSIPGHIKSIKEVGYVNIDEKKFEFAQTSLGKTINEAHNICIPEFMTPKFRANFIREIENIASGKSDFVEVYNKRLRTINVSYQKLSNYFPDYVARHLEEFKPCLKLKSAATPDQKSKTELACEEGFDLKKKQMFCVD